MNPDELLTFRRRVRQYTYSDEMPDTILLASADWIRYVAAMASMMPADDVIMMPTEEEVRWAWREGVTIIFEEPMELSHTIVSRDYPPPPWTTVADADAPRQSVIPIIKVPDAVLHEQIDPVEEAQVLRAVSILPEGTINTRLEGSTTTSGHKLFGQRLFYVGDDPSDIVSGFLPWGQVVIARENMKYSQSAHFILALVTAMGHRLTEYTEPTGMKRAAHRRLQRELPALRVIELAHTGSKPESRGGHVEWSRRWMVRGHWRNQPYGPGRTERRLTWIDPYVKGPDDKPLDTRPTVWVEN